MEKKQIGEKVKKILNDCSQEDKSRIAAEFRGGKQKQKNKKINTRAEKTNNRRENKHYPARNSRKAKIVD